MRTKLLSLGPELVTIARECTPDLNEAFYLAHRVMSQLMLGTHALQPPHRRGHSPHPSEAGGDEISGKSASMSALIICHR